MNYYNYFSEIENAFIKRRGKHMMLSPLDWSLIESWKEKGVPLNIAIRGIDNVFDSIERGDRNADIKSLSYCRDEIESLFSQWKKNQVGKNRDSRAAAPSPGDSPKTRIANMVDGLKSARDRLSRSLGSDQLGLLSQVVADLEAVDTEVTKGDKLEALLEDLDLRVDEFVLGAVDQPTLAAHRKRVREKMNSYKGKLSDEEFTDTIEKMLKRSIREHFELPRITLFDL